MNTQFVIDQEGNKIAVILPIEQYHKLLEDSKNQNAEDERLIAELKEAIHNLNLVKQGKLKANPAKDLFI